VSRRLKRIALVAISTLVALLVAEGMARLFGLEPEYGHLVALGDTPTRTVDGVVLWSMYEPRAADADIARVGAQRDAFTVVGLGDSIMYGVGQPKEQTYLEQARRAVAGRTTRPVSILNLAVPGYNTQQEAAVYSELGDRVAADLVLVGYWSDDTHLYRVVGGYVVDVGDMSADGHLVVRALPLPPAINDYLLVHSRLYELLTRAVVAHDRRAVASDWSRVSAPLVALNDRVRRTSGRMVVLAAPELDSPTPRPNGDLPLLRRLGAEHGFEVVDVSQWLTGVDAPSVRMDGCHFNAEGHRIVGEHLAEYLLSHDLKTAAPAH
jgi:GDSL-like Lipase/Acylhydrolase family